MLLQQSLRRRVSLASGSVVRTAGRWGVPFPRVMSGAGLGNGDAKCGEAVGDDNADLEFGDLTVEVAGDERCAEQLHAADLGLDMALAVVAAPPPPDRAT